MSKRITILGAGPGGYVAALRGAELGAQVTVIENDSLGGTCLNWGCIPTKTLKSSAEAVRKAERLQTFGIQFSGEVRPDFAAIMTRKDNVVSTLVAGIDKAFKTGKVRLIKGTGTVVDPHLVRVVDSKGAFHEVAGDKLILATGSRPQGLPNLLVKDIPPQTDFPELEVRQPQIYYGELTRSHVIVNTEEKELDFPSGEKNVYIRYPGKGGGRTQQRVEEVPFWLDVRRNTALYFRLPTAKKPHHVPPANPRKSQERGALSAV